MAKTRKTVSSGPVRKSKPPLTPEARENLMISLAMDLVEQRLRDGTASSQETTHFLKLGSMKERQEREKTVEEIKLLKAKTEVIETAKNTEELYANAIRAMQSYSGNGGSDDEDY